MRPAFFEGSSMAKLFLAVTVVLTLAPPADARSHHRTGHPAKPAAQATQDDKATTADKTSADIDKAMNRSLRGICRGC
jgi:hypothetical protein